MSGSLSTPVRMLLVGAPRTTFRQAAEMARETGAQVCMADDAAAALEQLRRAGGDLVMIDVALDVAGFIARLGVERMSVPVIACGIDAPADRAVAAVRAGARDYLPLPPQRDLIAAAIMSVAHRPLRMIAKTDAMTRAARFGLSMAASAAPILIRGEPGTGKEVMARAIHAASTRTGHFISVECQGVAHEILSSELFGHEAGAFAGAVAPRVGRLEEAANGTVFLRGIESLSPTLQADLLGALQQREVRRLGAARPSVLTARLIASTSRDLKEQVAHGGFRADLLARLSLAEVNLPPLRERGEDIAALAHHFAEHLAAANDMPRRGFDDEALAILARYRWPGNVRELEETVHRAMLISRSDTIGADALVHADGSRLAEHAPAETASDEITVEGLVGHTVADVERELILQTLERCQGNRTSASSILGISVRTMRNKLKSFVEAGIPVAPSH
ncbi:sigma-54-dependent transcriptional regulator [Stakelama marina]|uniref:Sigma-54-dependent Fis family transcriptional regulator n=1 Tax=Stakelama marina TaxID=2826939 RepID=A0A8T4ID76_9SPHN|nr:sigma-54 dependent transcriptional regulator [Stakelama marina]MBR0550935.1 sigma-54-dependent Fis family transcriptional regulator [Stakelama marina]